MFDKLKSLIFGLNEYDKTKIEVRFQLINEILVNTKIRNISDFEIIEDAIYKIKDQLRVKSSNLNKVILDPARNLRKKDVIQTLEKLNAVKYGFLDKAFSVMEEDSGEQRENSDVSSVSDSKSDSSEEIQTKEDLQDFQVIETDRYTATLENGKVPYIKVKFNSEVDYAVLRDIASVLFDSYGAHGTNIICEKDIALLVPRFMEDKLFELPKFQVDINEVFEKIRYSSASKTKDSQSQEYISIENKEQEFVDKKAEDSSLDELLKGYDNKRPKEFKPKISKEDNDENYEIIKGDSIEVEKKEKIKEPEIEVEKEKNIGKGSIETKPFEVYRDESIIAYFKEDSKVFGEFIVESASEKNFDQLNESEISYIMIFSKVFSSTLFEIMQAHGTNVIWDYNSSKLRIVPRFTDDGLALNLSGKESTEDFLEQVKNKLFSEMGRSVSTQDSNSIGADKKENKGHANGTNNENSSDSEKKAKFILDQIRKIP